MHTRRFRGGHIRSGGEVEGEAAQATCKRTSTSWGPRHCWLRNTTVKDTCLSVEKRACPMSARGARGTSF